MASRTVLAPLSGMQRIRHFPLFFIVPVLLCLSVITNPLHPLYYTGFSLVSYEGLNLWVYHHGPLFWIAVVYSYGLSFLAVLLILSHMSETGRCHHRPLICLLFASLAPFIANLMYVLKVPPSP